MKDKKSHIVKTLDNLPRFMFWTIDEAFCFGLPMCIGLALGSGYISLSGLLLKFLYSKLKKSMSLGEVKRRIYWSLPTSALKGIFKSFPPSHCREYIL